MEIENELVQISISLPKSHLILIPELMKVVINARCNSYSWDSIKLNVRSNVPKDEGGRIVLNLGKTVSENSEIVQGKFHRCCEQVCSHSSHYEGVIGDMKITCFTDKSIGDYVKELSKDEEEEIKGTGWLEKKLSDEMFYPSWYDHLRNVSADDFSLNGDRSKENSQVHPVIVLNNVGVQQFYELSDYEYYYPFRPRPEEVDNKDRLEKVYQRAKSIIEESDDESRRDVERTIRILKEKIEPDNTYIDIESGESYLINQQDDSFDYQDYLDTYFPIETNSPVKKCEIHDDYPRTKSENEKNDSAENIQQLNKQTIHHQDENLIRRSEESFKRAFVIEHKFLSDPPVKKGILRSSYVISENNRESKTELTHFLELPLKSSDKKVGFVENDRRIQSSVSKVTIFKETTVNLESESGKIIPAIKVGKKRKESRKTEKKCGEFKMNSIEHVLALPKPPLKDIPDKIIDKGKDKSKKDKSDSKLLNFKNKNTEEIVLSVPGDIFNEAPKLKKNKKESKRKKDIPKAVASLNHSYTNLKQTNPVDEDKTQESFPKELKKSTKPRRNGFFFWNKKSEIVLVPEENADQTIIQEMEPVTYTSEVKPDVECESKKKTMTFLEIFTAMTDEVKSLTKKKDNSNKNKECLLRN